MGNVVQDLCKEELHGERGYTWDDGVQRFWSNSKSEEGNEDDIAKYDKEP